MARIDWKIKAHPGDDTGYLLLRWCTVEIKWVEEYFGTLADIYALIQLRRDNQVDLEI